MKFNFDLENKKVELNANVEKLVEKGMDLNDKNWKNKFDTKHKAKKEILEIKHKHNLEAKEQDLKKKSFIYELFDGINYNKKLKIEEKRKIEEERIKKELEENNRIRKEKEKLGNFLFFIGFILSLLGFGFGSDGSGLQMIGSLGFISCIVGATILLKKDNVKSYNKAKKKEKRKN